MSNLQFHIAKVEPVGKFSSMEMEDLKEKVEYLKNEALLSGFDKRELENEIRSLQLQIDRANHRLANLNAKIVEDEIKMFRTIKALGKKGSWEQVEIKRGTRGTNGRRKQVNGTSPESNNIKRKPIANPGKRISVRRSKSSSANRG